MAILNVIGETHSDFEHAVNQAATLDLSRALAATAPRGCGVQHLVARERELPRFNSPRVRSLNMGVSAAVLGTLWHTRAAAKPLAGSLVHSLTPLVPLEPLRKHASSGTQTTVTVGHLLPYTRPEVYGKLQAQSMRRYIKRAIKHADAVLAPSFAAAAAIKQRFPEADPQILTLAAPSSLLVTDSFATSKAKQRRAELQLPSTYFVAIKTPLNSEIFDDLNELAPQHADVPIVVIDTTPEPVARPLVDPAAPAAAGAGAESGAGAAGAGAESGAEPAPAVAAPAARQEATLVDSDTTAIITIRSAELSDIAAVLDGSLAYIAAGTAFGQGYELYAALAAGKPIIYYTESDTQSGQDSAPHEAAQRPAIEQNVAAEIAQEAGIPVAGSAEVWQSVKTLPGSERLETATVIAGDRSQIYNWENTARALWQIHAEL